MGGGGARGYRYTIHYTYPYHQSTYAKNLWPTYGTTYGTIRAVGFPKTPTYEPVARFYDLCPRHTYTRFGVPPVLIVSRKTCLEVMTEFKISLNVRSGIRWHFFVNLW